MSLVDIEIKSLCKKGMVIPYEENLVNPASIDVRVGHKMLIMKPVDRLLYTSKLSTLTYYINHLTIDRDALDRRVAELNDLVEWIEVDLSRTSEAIPFWLLPNDRVLVESFETFNLPDDVTGLFHLKSSRAREFYEHLKAGFADPGWHGSKLTMELENRSLKVLPIYKGLRIGQIVFERTADIPEKSYRLTGRYNNDLEVQISKG